MKKALTTTCLMFVSSVAAASPQSNDFAASASPPRSTDFGVRAAPSASAAALMPVLPAQLTQVARAASGISLSSAVAVASRLGRVTSTRRSVARNRAVGGARNSFHLRGRAIDVVPRAGVRHSDIEAALRSAGFNLLESLDEGDHSHFAFGTAPVTMVRRAAGPEPRKEVTQWRMVSAPRLAAR